MSRLSAPHVIRTGRKMEFMVGSERMLRAHHKNGVFFKSLENKKNAYDMRCHKNLSKIQHEIYDVYFNEYLPLKEQATKTKFFPKLAEKQPPKYKKLARVTGNDKFLTLPDIQGTLARDQDKQRSSECFIEALRAREAVRKDERKASMMAPRTGRDVYNGDMVSKCSMWPDNCSDYSQSPDIDEYRLKILKTAIALTSQPPAKPVCTKRPTRLRKSFLLTLRRTSKTVWESDLLKRAGPPPPTRRKDSHRDSVKDSLIIESDETDGSCSPVINSAVLKWRPSIFRNRILNDEDEREEEDLVFEFNDPHSRESFVSMLSGVMGKTPRRSLINDPPDHDIEDDLYHPQSSPDIFSVISERTGSSYSDYSYTSGSGSYYSSDSDDGYK